MAPGAGTDRPLAHPLPGAMVPAPVRRAGHVLAVVALGSSLLALLALGVAPRTGRYRTVTVLSGSMRPSMPEGSVVVQTPAALADVKVGDVITYRIPVEDRRVVTHRVVEVVEAGPRPVLRTKGDANTAPDPWMARLSGEQVWKARAAVPKVGYALQALRHPAAQRLIVLLAPALLAVIWFREIWAAGAGSAPAPPGASTPLGPGGGRRRDAALAGPGRWPQVVAVPGPPGRWQGAAALAALAAVALLVPPRPGPRPRALPARRGRRGDAGVA